MPELDLNLLRVFDALMATGSVTGAADRLHLSAPATSRALDRLRTALGDPVLVKAGRGLVPTPYAQQTAARVRALLDDADGLKAAAVEDPARWRRTVVVRINDGLTPAIAPALVRRAAAEAPGVRLVFSGQDTKDAESLRDGSLDADVGIAVPSPSDVRSAPLLVDRFVAVVAARSELGRRSGLSVDDLVEHPHVSASRLGKAHGPLDDALQALGRSRRVVAVVPSYAVGALVALEEGLICLLPHLMTSHLVDQGVPLRVHEVPVALPEVRVEQRWHQRLDADPVSRWFRGLLAATARGRSGLAPRSLDGPARDAG